MNKKVIKIVRRIIVTIALVLLLGGSMYFGAYEVPAEPAKEPTLEEIYAKDGNNDYYSIPGEVVATEKEPRDTTMIVTVELINGEIYEFYADKDHWIHEGAKIQCYMDGKHTIDVKDDYLCDYEYKFDWN